jgi:hypothetical protein
VQLSASTVPGDQVTFSDDHRVLPSDQRHRLFEKARTVPDGDSITGTLSKRQTQGGGLSPQMSGRSPFHDERFHFADRSIFA